MAGLFDFSKNRDEIVDCFDTVKLDRLEFLELAKTVAGTVKESSRRSYRLGRKDFDIY